MSIPTSKTTFESALAGIPKSFRTKIGESYKELKRRASQADHSLAWDTAGLSAGKFCETVFRLLQYVLTGKYLPFGKHIANFPDECRKLITLPETAGTESLRIIIPRALVFLYTLRGKRGIGHTGGEIEANRIDNAAIVRVCDWIMCELIRSYHGMPLEEAQSLIDALAERSIPDVWEVAGKKRILRKELSFKQKTLLLTYSEPNNAVLLEDLYEWVEHSNLHTFKKDVLNQLHRDRLIEYDRESEAVHISPLGIQEVEQKIIRSVAS